jgi:hypothetical protein
VFEEVNEGLAEDVLGSVVRLAKEVSAEPALRAHRVDEQRARARPERLLKDGGAGPLHDRRDDRSLQLVEDRRALAELEGALAAGGPLAEQRRHRLDLVADHVRLVGRVRAALCEVGEVRAEVA